MSHIATTDRLFFQEAGLDLAKAQRQTAEALSGADDGELFLEYRQSEALSFDDGKLKSASFDTAKGFGLRAVLGDTSAYAHASDLSHDAIARASRTVGAIKSGHAGTAAEGPQGTNARLYTDENPLELMPFADKVKLLGEIDAYARAKDSRVRQVMCSIAGEWQAVQILRADGERLADVRPLVRVNVSVVVGDGDKQETGSYGWGGRFAFGRVVDPENWQNAVNEAVRQALVNLDAVPAPAGEMPVVLGPGWPGILLHEAIGHGLEGDFNRKKTSAFAGLMGQRVAAPGVTVVDDGTIGDRRGSLTIDDEGTPTQRTVLIEDGILRGYMQDRQNARLMGMKPTGNGRRESFAHHPMPRMTNTTMAAGSHTLEEMIASVERGLFAPNFGGGQVDITTGKFVFSASEAYLIENGKITAPVKGATLIGNGPEVMNRVVMIGNDLQLDAGVGVCGKNGQSVPVGVGQPSLKIAQMTVGGTKA
jgi:TldD protein